MERRLAEEMLVEVYGHPHSPWVQAVLLGLHDRDIPHELTTVAGISVFRDFGVSMPVARIDGGPWQDESVDILQRVGFGPVSAAEARAATSAWRGVFHRADDIPRFFGSFSRAGDPHPRAPVRYWRNFWRSFVALYFFLRLRSVVWFMGYRDPEDFGEQFLFWERKLASGGTPFLGGDYPDTADFLLFGVIQCHASIPVAPLRALREDPRLDGLRRWIARLHERFDGYPFLYSGPYFAPHRLTPRSASAGERTAFWAGLVCMVLAAPVTVPIAIALMRRFEREFRRRRQAAP